MLDYGVEDPKTEKARITAERAEMGTPMQGAQSEIESLFDGLTAQEQRNQINGAQPETEQGAARGEQ
jgi:hypothetical protein